MPPLLVVPANAVRRTLRHNGILFAGHLAFTAMLSFFPFLIFLTALAGIAGETESARTFVDQIFAYVPARVGEVLLPVVREVLSSEHGGLLTFSFIAALWVASSGVEAVRTVLNQAYGIKEVRPFWRRRLGSLAVVVTGGTLTLVLSLSVILGPAIWSVVTSALSLPEGVGVAVGTVRDLIAIGVLSGILTVLHAVLPCHRLRLRDVWPGAAVTAVLWIALATAFSIYLANLSNFKMTYGSLGGVVLTLVYFHVSAVLFIYGAELNAAIHVYRASLQRAEEKAAS